MPPNSTSRRLTFGVVGQGWRVDGDQRDVVPARHQLDRQRVVAETAAAIHPGGTGGDRQDLIMPMLNAMPNWSSMHRQHERRRLERSRPEQELDDVALVRLTPVELRRRHRAQVQAIDVHGVEQPAAERRRCR